MSSASTAMEELLGAQLLGPGGAEVSTTAATAGKKAVALYFSAHWCPPCRGFTPKLAKWYSDDLQGKGLEVVFVSSDRDQEAFAEYFGEMPWLALPYAAREAKEALSRKYKVRGIPSLVIVDAETGETITTEGREAVSKDPTGERLPWHPPTKAEKARALLDALGEDLVAQAAGKPIGLYFSAHWCPPCKAFTPQLAQWYADGLKDNLEIVFVSSDRDQAAFDDYFGEMPWKALPFDRRDAKEALSEACGVEGIPTLAVIDSATGSIITTDGRSKVAEDPTGATLASGGWLPQPFNDVNASPGDLNEKRCVVALGDDPAMAVAVKEVAEEQFEAAGKDVEAMSVAFYHAPPGGITGQIRKLTKMPEDEHANALILLDIPDSGSFYVYDRLSVDAGTATTAGEVKAFMRAVDGGKVEKRKFSG